MNEHGFRMMERASSAAAGPDSVPESRQVRSRPPLAPEFQEFIDGLDENVALIARDGVILAINAAWKSTIEALGADYLDVLGNYLSFWVAEARDGDDGASRLLRGFRSVASGRSRRAVRSCHSPNRFEGRHFKAVYSHFPAGDDFLVMASVHDTTEILSLKNKLRRLGSRVLSAQEAERRRVAREIHDGTAQMLVALQLGMMRLKKLELDEQSAALLNECSGMLERMQREIRALAFICHPPELKHNELSRALSDLVRGVASRTGIDILFKASDVGSLSNTVEATLYRLAQEALANIHRHARARHVSVELVGSPETIHLIVGDDGIGFDIDQMKPAVVGVGISGMRERVSELGGRLVFHRLDPGTALIASLARDNGPLDSDDDPKRREPDHAGDAQCA